MPPDKSIAIQYKRHNNLRTIRSLFLLIAIVLCFWILCTNTFKRLSLIQVFNILERTDETRHNAVSHLSKRVSFG